MERRRGPRAGARQHGNAPQYDVESGAKWRPNPTLEPPQAAKLYRALEALETAGAPSASGLINHLIARVDFDEDGNPVWADTREPIWPGMVQGNLVSIAERPTASQRAA